MGSLCNPICPLYGRSLWVWKITQFLLLFVYVEQRYKWCILHKKKSLSFPTDIPLLCLNTCIRHSHVSTSKLCSLVFTPGVCRTNVWRRKLHSPLLRLSCCWVKSCPRIMMNCELERAAARMCACTFINAGTEHVSARIILKAVCEKSAPVCGFASTHISKLFHDYATHFLH